MAEQVAAVAGLVAVGGRAAADVVSRLIVDSVVQGPALTDAAAAAASLGASLPGSVVASLLRHESPTVRTHACLLAGNSPGVIPLLIALLDDLHPPVAKEAACALGRMGRAEGLSALVGLLREAPSRDAIEAISAVADEDCLVLLGRIARERPDLREPALAVLDSIEHPRAATIARTARRLHRDEIEPSAAERGR